MKVAYSRALRRIFDLYLAYRFQRTFDQMIVQTLGEPTAADRHLPVLLVANHCSWWDGFFLAKLQRQIAPSAILVTIMLESELCKYPLFRRLGAMGVDPNNPVSVAHCFKALKNLVQTGKKSVFIAYFPQGEICPQLDLPLNFKPGIELLTKVLGPLQILPVALGIEPLRAAKPSAFILVGDQISTDSTSPISSKTIEKIIEQLLVQERPQILRQYLSRAAP